MMEGAPIFFVSKDIKYISHHQVHSNLICLQARKYFFFLDGVSLSWFTFGSHLDKREAGFKMEGVSLPFILAGLQNVFYL